MGPESERGRLGGSEKMSLLWEGIYSRSEGGAPSEGLFCSVPKVEEKGLRPGGSPTWKENLKDFIRRYPSYWRDRYPEVKQWRQQHPDYQRQWRQAKKKKRRSPGEIQVERLRKVIEFTEKTSFFLREIQTEILLKGPAIGSFHSARP